MTTSKKKMIKTKIWNSINAHLRPKPPKKKWQPSKTIPDQSMSLRELIDRQQRGLDIGGTGLPMYLDEDGIGVDMKKLSKIEQQELLQQAADELKELTEKMTSYKMKTKKQKEALKILEIEEKAVQRHIQKEAEKADGTNPT